MEKELVRTAPASAPSHDGADVSDVSGRARRTGRASMRHHNQHGAAEIRRLRRELRALTRERDGLAKAVEILEPAIGKLSKYGSVTILVRDKPSGRSRRSGR